MKLRYHAIAPDLFGALATGGGGPEAVGVLVAAEHSKHVILLRGVPEAVQAGDARQSRLARIGWEVLTEVERRDRDVVTQVTRYPAVGAWAIRTLRTMWRTPGRGGLGPRA